MRKLFLFFAIIFCSISYAQVANRLFPAQNTYQGISANNYLFTTPPLDNRIYSASMDSLKLKSYQIINLTGAITTVGNINYKPIYYTPTSTEIINGLGFTPLSAETDPLFNTKFSGKTTGDLAEGSNLYFNNARSRSALTLTTTGSGASTYNSGTGVINIPITSYTAGSGISISAGIITNTFPDQTVALTSGNGINITGSYPSFTVSAISPTITSATRALNTNYTVSTTKPSIVTYSVSCSATNPLLVGSSSSTAYLEYSLNSGSTWVTVSQNGNSSSVGVAVAIQLNNTQTSNLYGIIPANALVRIRTVTTGTASVTYITGQETVY